MTIQKFISENFLPKPHPSDFLTKKIILRENSPCCKDVKIGKSNCFNALWERLNNDTILDTINSDERFTDVEVCVFKYTKRENKKIVNVIAVEVTA